MNRENLIDSLEFLDNDLLLEAEYKRSGKSKIIYIRLAVAAAVCLVIGGFAAAVLNTQVYKVPDSINRIIVELPEETEIPNQNDVEQIQTTETPSEKIIKSEQVTEKPIDRTEEQIDDTSKYIVGKTEMSNSSDSSIEEKKEPEQLETPEPITGSENFDDTNVTADNDNSDDEKIENPDIDNEIVPTPDTDIKYPTPAPEKDYKNQWTENFVVSNIEYSYGTDKSESIALVEQLFFSGYDNDESEKELDKDWWYGIIVNDVLYNQAEVEVSEEYIESYIHETILKGINKNDYISKQTRAYVYKIKGISENAAVAVHIDEQQGYYLFINHSFSTSTLYDFINSYNVREYAKLKSVAAYDGWDKRITEDIDSDLIWEVLLSGDGSKVDYIDLYYKYDVSASIEMDIKIYGCMDIPIALYDEGYVVFSFSDINGAYYIGEDKISQIKNILVPIE